MEGFPDDLLLRVFTLPDETRKQRLSNKQKMVNNVLFVHLIASSEAFHYF